MNCKHLKECGSCTLFTPYNEQILYKTEFIKQNFSGFYDGEFEFFASSEQNYRTRAEFGIWHEIRASSNDICYTMHSSQKGKKIFIDECPKVAKSIADLMPKVLLALKKSEILRTRLFGVEFLSCTSGILLTLLYHKKLDDDFAGELKIFAKELGVTALARARGQKILSNDLELNDELNIDGKIYRLSLSENAFIQPNKAVNEKMISWAKKCVSGEISQGLKNDAKPVKIASDLLELYCGHGNFTIALAENFNQILATEISKSSIVNALKNCELNSVDNIKFLRMDADELMSAFAKEREFNRLREIDLDAFNFSHVLVDPPRAGLSQSVINFIKNYQNIIYISCNPDTLKENLLELCKTHEVVKFAIFDQFANTHHIECGVLLRVKPRN